MGCLDIDLGLAALPTGGAQQHVHTGITDVSLIAKATQSLCLLGLKANTVSQHMSH